MLVSNELVTIVSSWTGLSVEEQTKRLENDLVVIECGSPSDDVVSSLAELGWETWDIGNEYLEIWRLAPVAYSNKDMEMAAEYHELSRSVDKMFETGELGECCSVVQTNIPWIDLIDEDDLPF